MRFVDRVVVVTGGGSGIGAVMARMFAAEGAAVVVADWNADAARATVGSIEDGIGRAKSVTADISAPADVERLVATALSTFGRIDVLVNNAAVADGDDILLTEPEAWDHDVAVVLKIGR